MSADYKIVPPDEVAALLEEGYTPQGSPVWHPSHNCFHQAMVLPATAAMSGKLPDRGPEVVGQRGTEWRGYPRVSEVGFAGAPDRRAIAQTFGDVDTSGVVNKVFDVDGTELKVRDRVVILSGIHINCWMEIASIDPVFSKIISEHGYQYSSVGVRREWRAPDTAGSDDTPG